MGAQWAQEVGDFFLEFFDDVLIGPPAVEIDDFGRNVRKKLFWILMISYSFVPD